MLTKRLLLNFVKIMKVLVSNRENSNLSKLQEHVFIFLRRTDDRKAERQILFVTDTSGTKAPPHVRLSVVV